MARKRVAIVGGGPAGSALALNLVALGVDPGDLLILDKARFPRPKLCGGALTVRGTEALHALVGEPEGGARTVGLEFRSSLGRLDVFERGGQWIYDRGLLDDRLLAAAKEAGVEVRERTAVTALEPATEGWRVRTAAGSETFEWVAGADGACGISRRASGLPGGITGRLVEAVYEPVGEPPDPSRLYFDFDPVLDGIPGYAWIFPYPEPGEGGAHLWKLGIMDGRGRVPGRELRAWTERFAARHGFRCVEDKIAGWPERYYDRSTRGHRPGLVLVGEAYGIDALLGEGIAPALHQAAYAARRLAEALHAGRQRIRGFDAGFRRTLEGRNLWFQARLADRLYGPSGVRWMRVLFDLPRLSHLAGGGHDAYGRLARHIPSLIGSYLWRTATRGLPDNRVPEGYEGLRETPRRADDLPSPELRTR
jgi:flavin-dependent dehydrogenase